ncbi:radical SAM protein [Candidatus Venteria ishoeyi]|uniref:Radical SAM superfamily protein n=1 Tax=Candidatus Venteria ishoeyi TaxID=1899563 RepID=A0A1H6FGZ9_9GAMM|nr:radical SAM protein [Candidatus Venteria ishoeyi]SEH08436.1 Radical SAM superfamily protein [Candidatus Venteria ishoeyi]
MKKTTCLYYIDIVGTCNLRCPSCPVGNYQPTDFIASQRPKGFMEISFFNKILDKIEKETKNLYEHTIIALYNWGDPLLHPEFDKFISSIRSKGFYSDVSSNLNIENIKEVVVAAPDKLIVSLSGYYRETYLKTHKRGNPHLVVSNLFRLRYYMDKLKKDFFVEISYHLYQTNIGEDVERIQMICNDLGFHFSSDSTLLMPLEKNLKYTDAIPLSEEDKELVAMMLIKPEEQISFAQAYKATDCPLRDWTVINFDGTTALCCAVYDYQHNIANNFLDTPQTELDNLKRTHPLCTECMGKGLHIMASYQAREKLDKQIEKRLTELDSQLCRNPSHLRESVLTNTHETT